MKRKELFNMSIIKKGTKKEEREYNNDICAQCGWRRGDHRNRYCYHYSDQDDDYFYDDREFVPMPPKGYEWKSKAFNGMIIVSEGYVKIK